MRPIFTLLMLFCVTACSRADAIRPEELPKLGPGYSVRTSPIHHTLRTGPDGRLYRYSHAAPATAEVPTHRVVGEDGRLLDIRPPYTVLVSTFDGRAMRFDYPVRSTLEGRRLRVQGANTTPVVFDLGAIRRVEVEQSDPQGETWAMVGAGVAATFIAIAIMTPDRPETASRVAASEAP